MSVQVQGYQAESRPVCLPRRTAPHRISPRRSAGVEPVIARAGGEPAPLFGQRYAKGDGRGVQGRVAGYRVIGDKFKGVEPGFVAKRDWSESDSAKLQDPAHKFHASPAGAGAMAGRERHVSGFRPRRERRTLAGRDEECVRGGWRERPFTRADAGAPHFARGRAGRCAQASRRRGAAGPAARGAGAHGRPAGGRARRYGRGRCRHTRRAPWPGWPPPARLPVSSWRWLRPSSCRPRPPAHPTGTQRLPRMAGHCPPICAPKS